MNWPIALVGAVLLAAGGGMTWAWPPRPVDTAEPGDGTPPGHTLRTAIGGSDLYDDYTTRDGGTHG